MRFRSTLAVLAAAIFVAPTTARAQDMPGIAIMTFENGGSFGLDSENFDALRVGLQQMLITEFAANPGIRVVDRHSINDLIAEQDLGASGRVDGATAARIGNIVGARYMVLGGFIDFYGDMRLDIRIVDVETSEIVETQQVRDNRENLYDMVTRLARQITQGLDLPRLPEAIREARAERPSPPSNAVQFYSRALLYADRGNAERAAQLFNRALEEFPQYTEATEGLEQLGQS